MSEIQNSFLKKWKKRNFFLCEKCQRASQHCWLRVLGHSALTDLPLADSSLVLPLLEPNPGLCISLLATTLVHNFLRQVIRSRKSQYFFKKAFTGFWFIIIASRGWLLTYPLHQKEQLTLGHSTKHFHIHYLIWCSQKLRAGIIMSFYKWRVLEKFNDFPRH